jgi:hypothetical protein
MNQEVVTEIEGLLATGQYSKAGLKLGKNSHNIPPEDFNRLNKQIKNFMKTQPVKKGIYTPNSSGGKVFARSAIHR